MREVVPISFREAREFVRVHHRHARPPAGHLFSLGVRVGGELRAVAIVGRPVARRLQDGRTCEVIRLCTDGLPGVASQLLTRAKRVAQLIGYRRVVTYTLAAEPGTSLAAAGFVVAGRVKGAQWSRPSRPRPESVARDRVRWEARPW